ncbi:MULTISPECIES: hypothetical protein [Acidobacteriaceae]|uniref:hypothetical protein n=1 Tax=Acidobacteriaceae TaxID=204434 RepID=UPI00131E0DE7|nr:MULTISPECIES: hypothetical protein [Acidobacteriaceae]MDW5265810.1 hypothetical protein [Edaphobacter sp.]
MQTFATTRNAKEFLISRIITEAQLEGVSLSHIEQKMLYFSETGWTLPDITEASDIFDRDYDQSQYEQKIAALIRNLCAKARKNDRNEFYTWKKAVQTLRREDHYLLVLIDAVDSPPSISWPRLLKLSVITLLITCLAFVITYEFLLK